MIWVFCVYYILYMNNKIIYIVFITFSSIHLAKISAFVYITILNHMYMDLCAFCSSRSYHLLKF